MGKMGVSIYMKGYYEDFQPFRLRENKPNSKPIQSQSRLAPRPALGVEKTNPICRLDKLAQSLI